MQAGDKISFGSYEWRILEVQKNTALIITEYIIEQRAYHNAYKDIHFIFLYKGNRKNSVITN